MKTKLKKIDRMKTKFFTAISCVCCLCATSCKEHCPGFPEHLKDYYPYKTGDSLLFVNQYNDTLLFIMHNTYMVEERHTQKCGGCHCENPSFYFYGSTGMQGIISAGDKNFKPSISFMLPNGYLDKKNLETSYLITYDTNLKDPYDPKNNFLFGETVILEDKNKQISRVTIVKGNGITEFYDQKYDFFWKNIENNK